MIGSLRDNTTSSTMTTGQQLKAIRRHLSEGVSKVTQADMAAWLGTSQQAYSLWERDKYDLSKRDRLLVRLMWIAMEKGILKKIYWGER